MGESSDQVTHATRCAREDEPGRYVAPAPLRKRVGLATGEARDFVRSLYEKADADHIFFMAGAIAFNVLVAFVPLLLAALGIAGMILRLQDADATEPVLRYLMESMPPVSEEFRAGVRTILRGLVDRSTELLSLGTVILIWIATRLVGTLRTALREIFDLDRDRGVIEGKIFDIKMVFAAGTLLALNVGLTVAVDIVAGFGVEFFGLTPAELEAIRILYGQMLAFIVIWLMFLLVYRYLPARRIHWRTALIAATFTAILFEAMKGAFSWYVTNVADYRSTYGSLAVLIILILWIYYTAVVFILGGEVAQVAAMRRIRRRQKERLR